jgi:pilus assembly protein Flp/PilA
MKKLTQAWAVLFLTSAARLRRDDRGQDLIEYALLAGFIALIAIAAIELLGGGIETVFNNLATKVQSIPAT